jgi:hypothetical protein
MLDTIEQTLIDRADQLTVRPIFLASYCRVALLSSSHA